MLWSRHAQQLIWVFMPIGWTHFNKALPVQARFQLIPPAVGASHLMRGAGNWTWCTDTCNPSWGVGVAEETDRSRPSLYDTVSRQCDVVRAETRDPRSQETRVEECEGRMRCPGPQRWEEARADDTPGETWTAHSESLTQKKGHAQ